MLAPRNVPHLRFITSSRDNLLIGAYLSQFMKVSMSQRVLALPSNCVAVEKSSSVGIHSYFYSDSFIILFIYLRVSTTLS